MDDTFTEREASADAAEDHGASDASRSGADETTSVSEELDAANLLAALPWPVPRQIAPAASTMASDFAQAGQVVASHADVGAIGSAGSQVAVARRSAMESSDGPEVSDPSATQRSPQ